MKNFLPLPPAQTADSTNFVDIRNNHTLLRYFQNIEQQFKFANNFGVAIDDDDQAETGAKAVYLRELFVRPNLSKYHITPEQRVVGEINQQPLPELNIADLLAEHQRLFVLGDPGTGKSTLINSLMLAFSYYTDNLTKLALGNRVPFALILRDLPLDQINNWDDLWLKFLNYNEKSLTDALLKDSAVVNQLFTSGQAFIMLDGLDEITHSQQRKNLASAILQAMNRYPRCLFLITSRIIGFNQSEWFGLSRSRSKDSFDLATDKIEQRSLAELAKPELKLGQQQELLPGFYLSPFNSQQMQQFVNNWYQLYVPRQTNHEQRINDLKQRLQLNDGLGRLARVPVLLNMICFIHARRGRLPDGRAELYQRIAETYLVSLDKARGLKFKDQELRFDYYDLSEWLAEIAYTLQQRRTEENSSILISETEVKNILKNGLLDRGFSDEQSDSECQFILDYLSHRSGLFIPRGIDGPYAFSHLSFLEYFAACYLKLQAPLFKAAEWKALAQRTFTVWWHETLSLFFESLDNARLAEKYLDQLFKTKASDVISLRQNLLADIVMDTSVRLPIKARQKHIEALAGICLHNPYKTNHLAFRLCSENYNAVEYLINAKNINFEDTAFDNFELLARFTKLTELNLRNTSINNLECVQGLTCLTELSLDKTAITDLSLLSQLTQLQYIYISHCPVNDITPLANLKQLRHLDISNTSVVDLTPLIKLTELRLLGLLGIPAKDFNPLLQLHNLVFLFLSNTTINDLNVLKHLVKLEWLYLWNTQVTDISLLADLHKLEQLDLNSTPITEIHALANLTKLEELHISNTAITDLSPLANLKSLKELYIKNTNANPDVLKHLPNLKIHQ